MAEEMKQRFNAKAEIGIDEIEDDDIGIMTHRPNVLGGGDRKWKFGTLFNWIKRKLSGAFATKEELEPFATKIKELNVNLGVLEGALDDKADKTELVDWYHTTSVAYSYRNAYEYFYGVDTWVNASETFFKVYGKDSNGTCFATIKAVPNRTLNFYNIKNNKTYFDGYNQYGTIGTKYNNTELYIKPISRAEFDMEQELATMDKVGMPLALNIYGNGTNFIDISSVDNGVYLISANNLYSNWGCWYVGILVKYNTNIIVNRIASGKVMSSSTTDFDITTSGTNLTSNSSRLYGLKLFKMGYN